MNPQKIKASMLRLTDTQLAQLRSLPIEGVASRLGLTVTRHQAQCPFHDDRHPSLHFHVGKNTFKCYVCEAHGGPIDLVMNHLKLSFVEACKWLADDANIILSDHANSQTVEKKSYTFQADRYVRYFEHPSINPAASRFLYEERQLDARVIRWCRITSWTDRQGIDWLQTPYFDIDGRLTGIQWRNLSPSAQPRFRFPKGAKCHLYNLPVIKLLRPDEPLYIAEGASDCWSLLSAGHKAIAIPSATTLHEAELLKHLKSLTALHTPLHSYPDQDIPGEKLYLQLTRIATQAGLTLIRHSLPPGCKDYSDYYLRQHRDEKQPLTVTP